MENAQIPNAAPQAVYSGKVRSFWAILGLSIITCGIYYIVYHFMVASELKRATTWHEEESFKPSTFMVIFGAYVALSYAAPLFFGIAIGAKVLTAILANPNNSSVILDAAMTPYKLSFQIFMLLVSVIGYYVAYYFMKLNDVAAVKVGAKPLGIRAAFIAYSVFFSLMFLNSLIDIMSTAMGLGETLTRNMDDLSSISWGPLIIIILLGLGLTMLIMVSLFYFLWKQTELVNHVWLAGRFAPPVGGGQGYYASPSPQPMGQQPPITHQQQPPQQPDPNIQYPPPPPPDNKPDDSKPPSVPPADS